MPLFLNHQHANSGLRHIEAASFASPKWVPQMADGPAVIQAVFPLAQQRGVGFSVLAPNLRGLENAIRNGATEVSIFASATEAFSKANQNCTVEEGLKHAEAVARAASGNNIAVRGCVSCIVGDPYSGPTPPERVYPVVQRLLDMGCYEMGPRTFDTSIAGLGGCPFAPGAKGNVATEDVVYAFEKSGIDTGVDLDKFVLTGEWITEKLQIPTVATTVPKPAPAASSRLWKVVEENSEYRVSPHGSTLQVTLTRPRNGNSLTVGMVEGLTRLFEGLKTDWSIFHVVVSSEGQFFCTGMDLSGKTSTATADNNNASFSQVVGLYEAIEQAPQTTIAIIDGPCFGGGVGLAFACDIRLASKRAHWSLTEIKLGLVPAIISKYLLREWGPSVFRETMLTGREVTPEELLQIGAIHGLAESLNGLDKTLGSCLSQLQKCAPQSASQRKELVRVG